MDNIIAKYSTCLDQRQDLSLSKSRLEGLWVINAIFKAMEQLVVLHKTNFILASQVDFVFKQELRCLVTLVDKILSLDLSQITPGNASELVQQTENFQILLLEYLADANDFGMSSQALLCSQVLEIVQVLNLASIQLYQQSKLNIMQELDNQQLQPQEFNSTVNLDIIRNNCNELLKMSETQLRANLSNFVYDTLRIASRFYRSQGDHLNSLLSYKN